MCWPRGSDVASLRRPTTPNEIRKSFGVERAGDTSGNYLPSLSLVRTNSTRVLRMFMPSNMSEPSDDLRPAQMLVVQSHLASNSQR